MITTWGKSGKGKYYKRLYNKAARKAAKAALVGSRCDRRLTTLCSELQRKAT